MRRADAQDAPQQSRPPVGNPVTLDGSDSDEEQSGQQPLASESGSAFACLSVCLQAFCVGMFCTLDTAILLLCKASQSYDSPIPSCAGGAQGHRRTVWLVKGPGGQMVDARKIMGWVAAPDGTRVVCPRCEGRAFIRLGEVVPWPLVLCAPYLCRTVSS